MPFFPSPILDVLFFSAHLTLDFSDDPIIVGAAVFATSPSSEIPRQPAVACSAHLFGHEDATTINAAIVPPLDCVVCVPLMLESYESVASRLAFQVSDYTDMIDWSDTFKLFPNTLLSRLVVQTANKASLVRLSVLDAFVLKRIPYKT